MVFPNSTEGHSGDYLKVFYQERYKVWFKNQLSPNLFEPCLIILDKARYHKCKPFSTTNVKKMRKADIMNELSKNYIGCDSNITVTEARLILREWQNNNIAP